MEQIGFVYVMFSERLRAHKIGFTTNPKKRLDTIYDVLKDVQIVALYRLHSRKKAFKTEKHLHKYFQKKRVFGEWFEFEAGDMNLIKCIMAEERWHGVAIDIDEAMSMAKARNTKIDEKIQKHRDELRESLGY